MSPEFWAGFCLASHVWAERDADAHTTTEGRRRPARLRGEEEKPPLADETSKRAPAFEIQSLNSNLVEVSDCG